VNARWYVCLMLERSDLPRSHAPRGKQVGIDVGLKTLAALSEGEPIDNPRWLRASLAQLRRMQRHTSRQVKGSHRQRKAYPHLARLHEHVANQRADYLHKAANDLVRAYDLIAIEDLSLGFMNRNRRLSLSSYDAGFGLLRHMLEYKAESAGVQVIAVEAANTSQACSGCGKMVPKGLSVRVHECPDCGLVLDRDVNAARNILALALHSPRCSAENPLGRSGQALTQAVAPSVA